MFAFEKTLSFVFDKILYRFSYVEIQVPIRTSIQNNSFRLFVKGSEEACPSGNCDLPKYSMAEGHPLNKRSQSLRLCNYTGVVTSRRTSQKPFQAQYACSSQVLTYNAIFEFICNYKSCSKQNDTRVFGIHTGLTWLHQFFT